MCNQYTLNIDDNQATSEKSMKLLGVNIDNKLSFDEHVSSLCKKASNQLNAISRFHKYFGFKEKEVLINSFAYAISITVPYYGIFAQPSLLGKLNKFKQGHLEFCTVILIVITKLFLINQANAQ